MLSSIIPPPEKITKAPAPPLARCDPAQAAAVRQKYPAAYLQPEDPVNEGRLTPLRRDDLTLNTVKLRCRFTEGRAARGCFHWDGHPNRLKATKKIFPQKGAEDTNVFRSDRDPTFAATIQAREEPLIQPGIRVFPDRTMQLLKGEGGIGMDFGGAAQSPRRTSSPGGGRGPTTRGPRRELWDWQRREMRMSQTLAHRSVAARENKARVRARQQANREAIESHHQRALKMAEDARGTTRFLRHRGGCATKAQASTDLSRPYTVSRVKVEPEIASAKDVVYSQRRCRCQGLHCPYCSCSLHLPFEAPATARPSVVAAVTPRPPTVTVRPAATSEKRPRPASARAPSNRNQQQKEAIAKPNSAKPNRPLSARVKSKIADMATAFLTSGARAPSVQGGEGQRNGVRFVPKPPPTR